jgi:hypothetical protein
MCLPKLRGGDCTEEEERGKENYVFSMRRPSLYLETPERKEEGIEMPGIPV